MAQKEDYSNFDEYVRQGDPAQRERAEAWNMAIGYSPVYLERFFRNLLLGEQWDLRNRYLHIHPTAEWKVQPNLTATTSPPLKHPTSPRTSTRTSTRTSIRTSARTSS